MISAKEAVVCDIDRLAVLAVEINEKLTVARRHGQATRPR